MLLADIAVALAAAIGVFNVLVALAPVDVQANVKQGRDSAQVAAALVAFTLVLVERL